MWSRGRSEPGQPVTGGAGGPGVVVVASRGVWDVCAREEEQRGVTGGKYGHCWVHLAVDAPWTRSTSGVRPRRGGAEMGGEVRGQFVISKNSRTSL